MNWQEVIERPELQKLPFKIELTGTGQILMTPAKALHAAFRGEIQHLLLSLKKAAWPCPDAL